MHFDHIGSGVEQVDLRNARGMELLLTLLVLFGYCVSGWRGGGHGACHGVA